MATFATIADDDVCYLQDSSADIFKHTYES